MAQEQVRTMHEHKIPPPTYDGNYSQFEEWKYRFTAFAGLINAAFPRLLAKEETITTSNHKPTPDRWGTSTSRRTTVNNTGSRTLVHLSFNSSSITSSGSSTSTSSSSKSLPTNSSFFRRRQVGLKTLPLAPVQIFPFSLLPGLSLGCGRVIYTHRSGSSVHTGAGHLYKQIPVICTHRSGSSAHTPGSSAQKRQSRSRL